jgi:hypothetical protein
MTDEGKAGKDIGSKRMRTFWKVLSIILGAICLVCFLTTFSMYWWPSIPPSPRPSEGRVYPLNNHGHYTYMNREEHLLNESARWIFLAAFLPGSAIYYFVDPFDRKRRWRPVRPPQPWW